MLAPVENIVVCSAGSMSQKVKCPHCGGSCSVEDRYLGKKMQCPRCSKVFQAGNEPLPPPARPAPRKDPVEAEEARSARIAGSRRRRRFATANALLLTLAAAGALAAVAWHANRTGLLKKFGPAPAKPPAPRVDQGLGRGFHILSDSYWSVFDDVSLVAKPVVKQPVKEPGPAAARIDSEGLELHEMKVTGPWYLVNDMGGLVPSAVGVWVSPNQLGQGKEAFYVEPGEEVTVSHWVKNFGGFKVFRVVNTKRRPGPGSKVHEAGWIIGLYLRDADGEPIK